MIFFGLLSCFSDTDAQEVSNRQDSTAAETSGIAFIVLTQRYKLGASIPNKNKINISAQGKIRV